MPHSSPIIRKPWVLCTAFALASWNVACNGDVDTAGANTGAAPTSLPGPGAAGPSAVPGGPATGAATASELTPSGRLYRLTHRQYQNSVLDTLSLDRETALHSLTPDANLIGRFDNHIARLDVSDVLWSNYQTAAELIAAHVVSDESRLNEFLSGLGLDPGVTDAATFVEAFGHRAFRRPLSAIETAAGVTLFERGKAAYTTDASAAVSDSIRFVVEAFLQAPQFLYRQETPQADSALAAVPQTNAGDAPLDGYSLASKLSYFLTDSPPDLELLACAETLVQPAVYATQVARILDSPRSAAAQIDFFEQFFHFDEYRTIKQGSIGDWPETLGASSYAETRAFVEHLYADNLGWHALLTSRESFVNQDLAELYDLAGSFGPELTRVELPQERPGLLTRIGFLARFAEDEETDPIHRGVFVNYNILCTALPPAPPNAVANNQAAGETTRERVESITGPGTCGASCHGVFINPLGYAFEGFDALGRLRTEQNGSPIDSSGAFAFDTGPQDFNGANELVQLISETESTHACFVQGRIEQALGRTLASADDVLVRRLAQRSKEGASFKQLLQEIINDRAFTHRRDDRVTLGTETL